jgi:hypothetical protein
LPFTAVLALAAPMLVGTESWSDGPLVLPVMLLLPVAYGALVLTALSEFVG